MAGVRFPVETGSFAFATKFRLTLDIVQPIQQVSRGRKQP